MLNSCQTITFSKLLLGEAWQRGKYQYCFSGQVVWPPLTKKRAGQLPGSGDITLNRSTGVIFLDVMTLGAIHLGVGIFQNPPFTVTGTTFLNGRRNRVLGLKATRHLLVEQLNRFACR